RPASRVNLRSDAVYLTLDGKAGQRVHGDIHGLAHLDLAEIARRDRRPELEHRIVDDRVERGSGSDNGSGVRMALRDSAADRCRYARPFHLPFGNREL